jgi:hypothetical protein
MIMHPFPLETELHPRLLQVTLFWGPELTPLDGALEALWRAFAEGPSVSPSGPVVVGAAGCGILSQVRGRIESSILAQARGLRRSEPCFMSDDAEPAQESAPPLRRGPSTPLAAPLPQFLVHPTPAPPPKAKKHATVSPLPEPRLHSQVRAMRAPLRALCVPKGE